ncbi:transposase [Microcystis aeruginosa]
MAEICDRIRQHSMNGAMEGLNNRSRVILRQTYGLRNFQHLHSRLLAANR